VCRWCLPKCLWPKSVLGMELGVYSFETSTLSYYSGMNLSEMKVRSGDSDSLDESGNPFDTLEEFKI
jgi:hypothetical protein